MDGGRSRRLIPVPDRRYWIGLTGFFIAWTVAVLWACWWAWSILGNGPGVPSWLQLVIVIVSLAVFLLVPKGWGSGLDSGNSRALGPTFVIWAFGSLVGAALLMIFLGLGAKGANEPNLEWVKAGATLLAIALAVYRTV